MSRYALTGSASGIGAAIKRQLLDQGHHLLTIDRQDADVIADLATDSGRKVAIAAIQAFGAQGLDGLIPCAGVGPHTLPANLMPQINYFACVELVNASKPLLASARGTVVLIASQAASAPGYDQRFVDAMLNGDESLAVELCQDLIGSGVYAATKRALTIWMRRNCVAYAADGVRLNAVAPGVIATPLSDGAGNDVRFKEAMTAYRDSVPVGEVGAPEDVAELVTFLLSPKGRFFCGSIVFIDGGSDAMMRPDQF